MTPTGLPPAPLFSYSDLTPEAVQVAQAAVTAIRTTIRGAYREVGKHLLQAKAALPHGKFTEWAEIELGINARSARNYMQTATFLEGKSETIADLPPTILYALSAPSAPAEVVQQVVETAAAGLALDAGAIEAGLVKARQISTELALAQKRKPDLTRAELLARKGKQRQQHEREDQARREDEAADEHAAQERAQLLADALLGLSPDVVDRLVSALASWREGRALQRLLVAAQQVQA